MIFFDVNCLFLLSFAGGKIINFVNMTFEAIREKLKVKTVGIAGVGGLGSNCAVSLVRVGLGNLIIADFDKIISTNLNRQYYFLDQVGEKKVKALRDNLLRINPGLNVIAFDDLLLPENIPGLFRNCDIIVEAFDDAGQKEMLIETVLTHFPEKPLVVGLGIAGWGMNNTIKVRQINHMYICGDEVSEIAPELPPLAPRVGIVANMQANVVLEILLKI
jgi:sulfur carrier protein ThiS adenylyltransferase